MYQTKELQKSNIQLDRNDNDTTSYLGMDGYAIFCRAYKDGKRAPLFDGYYRHADLIKL